VLALGRGFVPPTLGTEFADPALPECRVVTAPESVRARHILLLAESFGGRCAALTLARAA
jgi:3-oxoacyl-(acyl-carrier-protein) synthase